MTSCHQRGTSGAVRRESVPGVERSPEVAAAGKVRIEAVREGRAGRQHHGVIQVIGEPVEEDDSALDQMLGRPWRLGGCDQKAVVAAKQRRDLIFTAGFEVRRGRGVSVGLDRLAVKEDAAAFRVIAREDADHLVHEVVELKRLRAGRALLAVLDLVAQKARQKRDLDRVLGIEILNTATRYRNRFSGAFASASFSGSTTIPPSPGSPVSSLPGSNETAFTRPGRDAPAQTMRWWSASSTPASARAADHSATMNSAASGETDIATQPDMARDWALPASGP